MIEAARGKTRIVDGYESSYGYKTRGSLAAAYEAITQKAALLMADQAAYRRVVSPGFGLWLDRDWRKQGWNTEKPETNYFSPEAFGTALGEALRRTDEYVWIYTETPRWWNREGKAEKLPEAYVRAIRQAREGCRTD